MTHELEQLLDAHRARHPQMQPRDYYKLLYQREFGCGHMAPAPQTAARYLLKEYIQSAGLPCADAVPERRDGSALPGSVEDIGNGLCRVYLDGAWSREALRLLGHVFCSTAREHAGDAARFAAALDGLERWADTAAPAPWDVAALRRETAALRSAGCPAVHHSAAYREQCAPHYRVVCQGYADAWPALLTAQRVLESAAQARPVLLAIDGRCGSGKSTLAAQMAQVFGCPVFHMDDFFLPPELRTPERLARPGENVHHERFLREVLEPFAAGRTVHFRPFDCSIGAPGPAATVPAAPFAVVEGSYSLHPALRGHYAASVFVTCAPQVQRARLTDRGGADSWAVFEARWIPLEEAYFEAYGVQALAGMTLDTTAFP